MAALSIALALAHTLVAQNGPSSQPSPAKTTRSELVYQKSEKVHRILVTVPADEQGWVRTGINPQALAGRPVVIAWTANIAYVARLETEQGFKKRLSNIALRQVRDASKKPTAEPVAVTPSEVCTRLIAGVEAPLPLELPVCFAPEPGEIELRFNGARPGDRGHYRVFFAAEAMSKADSIVNDGVVDKIELFEPGRALTAPPPLPEPRWR